jgi:hypothetical protein
VTPPSDCDDEGSYTGLLSSVSDCRSAGVLFAELLSTARSPVLGGTNPRTGRLADHRHRFPLLLFRILGHFNFLLTSGESAAVTQHLLIRRASFDLMMRVTPAGRLTNFKHLAEPRRPGEKLSRASLWHAAPSWFIRTRNGRFTHVLAFLFRLSQL